MGLPVIKIQRGTHMGTPLLFTLKGVFICVPPVERERKMTAIVEQKMVEMYGDEVTAVRADDGQIYVSITHMCAALGLKAQSQRNRMNRHKVLKEGVEQLNNLMTAGGLQRGYVLRVDLVPLWLAGVQVSAVKDELKDKLYNLQKNASKILWEAFQTGELTIEEDFNALLEQDSPAVDAYKTAVALVKLARNQVLLEARLGHHGERLDDLENRLTNIEADLHDEDRTISEEQATQISQAVRAIGLTLTKTTGENQYGKVWGEFYRKFGVSKYRKLSMAKFEDAMRFLTEWYGQLTDEELPF